MVDNLYVHFPFCRCKCSYCTLYSRIDIGSVERNEYARMLVPAVRGRYKTAYFGGGSPALCDLTSVLEAIEADEFTVELHPLDITRDLLKRLRDGGVNRISMGLQSLDDAILDDMGRGYTFVQAEAAFYLVKEFFDNAGIDLIVGYPGESSALLPRHARLAKWQLRHCSVYALQNERKLKGAPDDEAVMNRLGIVESFMHEIGLERYEISNYAVPGYECRHNLAVWRGEDYLGIGAGACGRVGLRRTRNQGLPEAGWRGQLPESSKVSEDFDEKERRFFRLRTRDGLDASGHPEWESALGKSVNEGLLRVEGKVYFLTDRGREVCDAILSEII